MLSIGAPATPDRPIAGYDDLRDYLNALNAQWTGAAQRQGREVQDNEDRRDVSGR